MVERKEKDPQFKLFNDLAEKTKEAPLLAICVCCGMRLSKKFSDGHKTFVVRRMSEEWLLKKKGPIWEESHVLETNNLEEALKIEGAVPYGSAFMCSSCHQERISLT